MKVQELIDKLLKVEPSWTVEVKGAQFSGGAFDWEELTEIRHNYGQSIVRLVASD